VDYRLEAVLAAGSTGPRHIYLAVSGCAALRRCSSMRAGTTAPLDALYAQAPRLRCVALPRLGRADRPESESAGTLSVRHAVIRSPPGRPGITTPARQGEVPANLTNSQAKWKFRVTILPMPKFVIERNIPGVGSLPQAELQAISQKSCSVLRSMGPQIQWLQSYVTADRIYCIYIAPDEKTVREHAASGGFPADRVSQVYSMIDPTTAEV